MKIPLIFDIRRYSINDGPGIRMTVFFKGCPLKCRWCHNPESQSAEVQKLYTASKCIAAQECIRVCPKDALRLTSEGIVTDYDACDLCGECAKVCPTKAIEMSGKIYNSEDLLKIIEREQLIFDQSGGGITFSGGEPLMFPEYLTELLDACGQKGIHRTVDTCGYVSTKVLLKVAERTDLFLFDLKHMDPVKHKDWTGVKNHLILKNLKALAESGAEINIRIPLIKNVNLDEENLIQKAQFIAGLPGKKLHVNLLPYHPTAENKYKKLGITYLSDELEEPSEEDLVKATGIFKNHGLEVETGG